MSLREITLKLAPDEEYFFRLRGNYLRIKSANQILQVRDASNHLVDVFTMVEGDDARFFEFFDDLALKNLGVSEDTVTVIIGRNAQITRAANITGGGGGVASSVVVSNFPAGFNVNNFPAGFNVNNLPIEPLSKSKSGVAFAGGYSQAAVAGVYSHVQLWNPAGSGKNLIVYELAISAGAVAYPRIAFLNSAFGAVVAAPQNLLFGNAQGVAEVRGGTNAATQGAIFYLLGLNAAGVVQQVKFGNPIVLPPNNGLVVFSTTVNVALVTSFQWTEEAI